MAMYVDDLRQVIKNRNWPYNKACHMVSDSLTELHAFARRLSLKRCWYQGNTLPHYDLTPNKRIQALRLGAIEITDKQLVEMISKYRKAATDVLPKMQE